MTDWLVNLKNLCTAEDEEVLDLLDTAIEQNVQEDTSMGFAITEVVFRHLPAPAE